MQKNIFWVDQCPFHLSELMETCLGHLNLKWCIIYLDNILIFSKDPTSHLFRLETMFKKSDQAKLKLKPLKCELFHKQITYLQHIVSTQGIATDRKKTEVIESLPPPLLLRSQAFWDSQDTTSSVIPKFTQIALPLHELMSRENAGKRKASHHLRQ